MTVTIHTNGTGGLLGDELVTQTELYTTGAVYFVHHSGDNTNDGSNRLKPWATLVYALTQAATNDIIVLLDGHAETIASTQTISTNGLKIVGEGSDEGVPTVTLTSSLTDQKMLVLSGTNIALGNIKFPGGGTLATVAKIHVSGERSMIRGCYAECDAADQFAIVFWDSTATGARLFNTKFVVTSTTTAPAGAVLSNSPAECEMEAVTFDGGSVGFTAGFAYVDLSALGVGAGPSRLRCQQMRLMNGAGAAVGPNSTGYFGIAEKSGAPSVQGFSRRLAAGFRQLGDAMLADTEFYMNGNIFYVHYGTGNDANSGIDELAPKKTINGAMSVTSTDTDIVVLLPGHDEKTSSTISWPFDGVTLIGCGVSGGLPSCKIHSSSADPIIEMGSTGYLRNVWAYDEDAESGPTKIVDCTGHYLEVRGCYIQAIITSVIGVAASGSFNTFRDTRFESGSTDVTRRPARGLSFSSAGTMTDADVRGCIFSNGEHGFEQFAFDEDEPVTRLYCIAASQLFGADVNINSSTTGLYNPETSSGSASVSW